MRHGRRHLPLVAGLVLALVTAWAVPGSAPAEPVSAAAPRLAAAALDPDAHLTVTVASDFHVNTTAPSPVLAQVAAIDPAFHLAVGDLTYATTGEEQTWCDYYTAQLGGGFPFEVVSGNHESDGQNGNINDFTACLPNQLPGLVGTYGRQWYVDVPQDAPLVRVIAISPGLTYPSGDWSYAAGSARYQWTSSTIDAARAAGIPWVVVGMHMPCVSVGIYGCAAGPDIVNLLLSKRVDLVVTGHEHAYMRTHQLATRTGCTALATGTADPDCVVDTDSAFAKGAGTVVATVGTGGAALREVSASDGEAPYFAAFQGLNVNPTWGSLRVDLTPTTLGAQFVRASGGTFTDAFTIADSGTNPPPVAAFTSSCTGRTCSFDGRTSADDGTIAGYAWSFGDGTTGAGATPSHTYAADGTYPVTLTVTDDDGATAAITADVTVTAGTATPIAFDAFGRTVASGWGTADTGGPWTGTSGLSVDGSAGRLTIASPGQTRYAYLGSASAADVDVTVRARLEKVATGGGTDVTVVARRVAAGTQYEALTKVLSTGAVRLYLRRVAGGTTTLAQVAVPGLTVGAGDEVRLRLQVLGTSPTTLRARVWSAGAAEPSSWQVSATDSTAALQRAGAVGLQGYVSSSTTNTPQTVAFDDLAVTAP